MIKYGIKYLA